MNGTPNTILKACSFSNIQPCEQNILTVNKEDETCASEKLINAYLHGELEQLKEVLDEYKWLANESFYSKEYDNLVSLIGLAITNGRIDVIRLLVKQYDVDINKSMGFGEIPIFLALDKGDRALLTFLIVDCGARMDVTNIHGDSALAVAMNKEEEGGSIFNGIYQAMEKANQLPNTADLPVDQRLQFANLKEAQKQLERRPAASDMQDAVQEQGNLSTQESGLRLWSDSQTSAVKCILL